MNELPLTPYMPRQIALEETYYNELYGVLGILIDNLIDYIDSKENITLYGVKTKVDIFINNHTTIINAINSAHSTAINALSYQALYPENALLPIEYLQPNYIKSMRDDFNIMTNNLIGIIQGRFLDLIPVGTMGVSYLLYTQESTRADLIERCNNSIQRFVQTSTTEAMFESIKYNAEIVGATEYLPDNQHDDKVRPSHKLYFNGKDWIPFDNPPPCGHPGQEWNCRCYIKAIR